MSDPMKDMDELIAINEEREAAGLAPLDDVVMARQWKSEQKAKPVDAEATEKPAEQKPVEQPAEQADISPTLFPVAEKKTAPASAPDDRVAQLERELQLRKTEEGRVAALDRRLKEAEARAEEAERKAAEAERKAAEAQAQREGDDILAGLSQEERDAIDPVVAKATALYIKRMLGGAQASTEGELAKTREMIEAQRQVAAEREAQMHESAVMSMWSDKIAPVIPPAVYSQFGTTYKAKWAEWCRKSFAGQLLGDTYTAAVASLDSEAVIDLLGRFMKYAGIEVPSKGNKPPLRSDSVQGAQVTEKPAEEEFYADDAQRIEEQFVQGKLPAGWTHKQFEAWAKRLDDARFAGRVKPGSAPR